MTEVAAAEIAASAVTAIATVNTALSLLDYFIIFVGPQVQPNNTD